MNEIVNLCDESNLILIEDSAQSLGCKINEKSLGTFGKIGCFSLSTPKIISTGQGGFCITDDDILAKKINLNFMFLIKVLIKCLFINKTKKLVKFYEFKCEF